MIRVGLVGFGLAGRVFHAPLISSVEGLELAAVVERATNKASALYPGITTYRSIEELLADASIKLVVVATPNATHHDIALRVLEAAKSVVVDKPMSTNSTQIAELMELAGGIGLQLVPFHNRRWDSDFQTIQRVLHEKQLGQLVHFESTFDRWRPGSSSRAWKEDPGQGGLLLDLGTHLVDQAIVLFGVPESVGAEIRHERTTGEATDSFTLRLNYFTGVSVAVSANCLSSLPRPRFHLRGTKGNFCKWGLDPQEDALGKITRIDAPDWGVESSELWGMLSVDADGSVVTQAVTPIAGDYRLFYTGVRDALLGKGPAPVTALDAWRAARVLEYAVESARTHHDIECDWSSEPS
ncbi:MAG TPA: Gfo/Idh/MocA family oxidoreductase [Terracidiphilus sp.]|jgi:scyllo-inositol 2-dehydrogenase (NADP+)|nr:Gfo/Idh/MocA family oxidoreductase [Terracidiphilus sp.]